MYACDATVQLYIYIYMYFVCNILSFTLPLCMYARFDSAGLHDVMRCTVVVNFLLGAVCMGCACMDVHGQVCMRMRMWCVR